MPRLDSLRIFTEVVATRSFTSAGKRLGLTPSAVSKQIGLLEKRLGVRLLNRTTRAVSATEAGEIYAERCRRILEELDDVESLVGDMDNVPRGTLKIAVEPVFGRSILAGILAEYAGKFPNVTTELLLTDHCLELVKQGFDAGVHLGSITDPALIGVQIANQSVVLCASSEYIDANGAPVTTAELSDHRLIKLSSMELRQNRQLDDFFATVGINSGFAMTVNDTDMAYHAVIAGHGIAPLPNYLVEPQIERGRFVRVLPDLVTETQPVCLVIPAHRHLSSKSQSFISFLKDFFEVR